MSAVFAAVSGCCVSAPFKWMDDDKKNRAVVRQQEQQVIVAITHATVDSAQRKIFDQGANRVIDSLPSQPGLLGYSLRRQLFGDEVWTATVWRDEKSLLQFVQSPAHVQAVKDSYAALIKIDYTRIAVKRSEFPASWSELLSASRKIEQAAP